MASDSPAFCNLSSKIADMDPMKNNLYLIGGTLITVFNLALGLTIICHKEIRQQKEYLLYAGCMFFDVIFGSAYISAGASRVEMASAITLPMSTKYGCMMTAHSFFFVYITPGAGILVFITAVDRFIGVFFPTKYIMLRTRYAYSLLFLIFSTPLIAILVAVLTSMPYDVKCDQNAACSLSQATTYPVYLGLRLVRIVGSLACVVIYVPITAKIIMNVSRTSAVAYMATAQHRRLIRMTVTVILVTMSTICLYAVPDLIVLLNPSTSSFGFYIMNMGKGLVNILIFLVTQKTLRKAIYQSISRGTKKSRLVSVTNQKSLTVSPARKFSTR